MWNWAAAAQALGNAGPVLLIAVAGAIVRNCSAVVLPSESSYGSRWRSHARGWVSSGNRMSPTVTGTPAT
jgi:hypothetical protein